MSTGDLKNNLRLLQAQVKSVKYPETLDLTGLSKGIPAAFLPIYHYAFTSYNPSLVQSISDMDIELYGKSDLRFMESVYKLLRDMFNYKPSITKDQFFSSGFIEHKVIMCTKILQLIRTKVQSHQTSSARVNSSLSSLATSKASTSRPISSENRRISGSHPSLSRKTNLANTSSSSQRPGSTEQILAKTAKVVNELRATRSTGNLSMKADRQRMTTLVKKPPIMRQAFGLCDGPAPATPSIGKVKRGAVEVLCIPRDEVPSMMNESETPKSSPATLTLNDDEIKMKVADVTHIMSQISSLTKANEDLTRRLSSLESTNQRHQNSSLQDQPITNHQVTCNHSDKLQQMDTLIARLVLLENRVAMLEANPPQELVSGPATVKLYQTESTHIPNLTNDAVNQLPIATDGHLTAPDVQDDVVSKPPISDPDKDIMDMPFSPIKTNGFSNSCIGTDADMISGNIDDSNRRSSTPTGPVTPAAGPFSDQQTVDQVDRIKTMLKDTDDLFKNVQPLNMTRPET